MYVLQDDSGEDHHVRGPQSRRQVSIVLDAQSRDHGQHSGKPHLLQQAHQREGLHHLR